MHAIKFNYLVTTIKDKSWLSYNLPDYVSFEVVMQFHTEIHETSSEELLQQYYLIYIEFILVHKSHHEWLYKYINQ